MDGFFKPAIPEYSPCLSFTAFAVRFLNSFVSLSPVEFRLRTSLRLLDGWFWFWLGGFVGSVIDSTTYLGLGFGT